MKRLWQGSARRLSKTPFWLIWLVGYGLAQLALDKIWGIGSQTKAFLEKHGMRTALDFARRDEAWVTRSLTKPHVSIWKELRGECVFELDTAEKHTYSSIP